MSQNLQNASEEELEIITVRVDKEARNRYLLYAAEGKLLLSLHEDIMVAYRLFKGSVVTPELIEEIVIKDLQHQAYSLGLRYLGAKPRTRNQLKQYLQRKEMDEQHIEHALDRLENENLVDDEEYAKQFAASRMNSGLKGRLMIRQELQQRGVPKELASAALSQMDESSELEAAQKLALKKSRSVKGELRDRKNKLTAFLLRRGFPSHIVREALKGVSWEPDHSSPEEEDGAFA
ncbi:regulatory protein RecX [Paenibacillus sp. CAU 1782]